MSRSPVRDFLVGIFVLAGLAAIAYLSITVGGFSLGGPSGMKLFADFDEIGGLKPRAQVVISGVKVGQVTNITLDKDYRARVALEVRRNLELPVDTTASIVTAGLLGDRYISLQLGGEEQYLKSSDTIRFTESAILLERLLGKFIYSSGSGTSSGGGSSGASLGGGSPGGSSGGTGNNK
jgi:phospholipid/cholesterol/gamma-HCH transport system substrate-binding protein